MDAVEQAARDAKVTVLVVPHPWRPSASIAGLGSGPCDSYHGKERTVVMERHLMRS